MMPLVGDSLPLRSLFEGDKADLIIILFNLFLIDQLVIRFINSGINDKVFLIIIHFLIQLAAP
jgi:hypothetical protein